MEPSLFRYIWQHSRRDQLLILVVIVLSLPFYYASFDIPKRIINEAIQGRAFAGSTPTAPFLALSFTLPSWLGGTSLSLSDGFQLERVAYLLALSFVFLAFVIINGAFKQSINISKGVLGERMLRRMRFDLYTLLLRLKPEDIRAVKPAEAANIINNEVDPIGGFIGDAFILPAFLGMQAVTALVFIAAQNMWLGGVALAVVLIQAFIIPQLRKEQLRLSRIRQIETRKFAGRIGELIEIAPAIHNHGAGAYTKADIGQRLGTLFSVRVDLFKRKFAVKYLNNLLAQITPFFFYAIGGYLAIKGQLDIGQLVAALAAYKDLPPPIKELIDWDQTRADVLVKYEEIVAQFPPELSAGDTTGSEISLPAPDMPIVLESLRMTERRGQQLLEPLSLTLKRPSTIALVGPSGSGKDIVARVLGRQISGYKGSVRIGNVNLATLRDEDASRLLSYAGPDHLLFQGSIRDNIGFGLVRSSPPETGSSEISKQERVRRSEALRSGNPQALFSEDWIDHVLASDNDVALDARIMGALNLAGIGQEIYRFGLQGRVVASFEPELVARLLLARREIRAEVVSRKLEHLIEPFDATRYNRNSSIAENLLFGVRVGKRLRDEALGADPYFRSILEAEALRMPLAEIGLRMAESAIELFSDLPAGHPLFERFSFVKADNLPEITRSVDAVRMKGSVAKIGTEDFATLVRLALGYVEPRLRLGLVDPRIEARIVRARRSFRSYLPQSYAGEVSFYEEDEYLDAAPILDNLLFGRITYGIANADARVNDLMRETLKGLDLDRVINRLGLDRDVGIGGRGLFPPLRAAVSLSRALIANPSILVIDGALSALSPADARQTLADVRASMTGRTLVLTATTVEDVSDYDHILVFDGGRLIPTDDGIDPVVAVANKESADHAPA